MNAVLNQRVSPKEDGEMETSKIRHYISQMLSQLADLADGSGDDEAGSLAFKLRLLADGAVHKTQVWPIQPPSKELH